MRLYCLGFLLAWGVIIGAIALIVLYTILTGH